MLPLDHYVYILQIFFSHFVDNNILLLIYQLMRRQLSMGRTIPSHRMASVEERKEWKGFRQALDKSDRKTFDEI
jgi:hypothetical protein